MAEVIMVNRVRFTSSLDKALMPKLDLLSKETRIPKSRLLDEAVEDLLEKYEKRGAFRGTPTVSYPGHSARATKMRAFSRGDAHRGSAHVKEPPSPAFSPLPLPPGRGRGPNLYLHFFVKRYMLNMTLM